MPTHTYQVHDKGLVSMPVSGQPRNSDICSNLWVCTCICLLCLYAQLWEKHEKFWEFAHRDYSSSFAVQGNEEN